MLLFGLFCLLVLFADDRCFFGFFGWAVPSSPGPKGCTHPHGNFAKTPNIVEGNIVKKQKETLNNKPSNKSKELETKKNGFFNPKLVFVCLPQKISNNT